MFRHHLHVAASVTAFYVCLFIPANAEKTIEVTPNSDSPCVEAANQSEQLTTSSTKGLRDRIKSLNELAQSLARNEQRELAVETSAQALALCCNARLSTSDPLFLSTQNQYEALRNLLGSLKETTKETGSASKEQDLLPEPAPAECSSQSNEYHWKDGAQNCEKSVVGGTVTESLTADGLRVDMSLIDTGKKYKAEISIKNEGTKCVEIVPSEFTAALSGKKQTYSLKYEDSSKLAKKLKRNVIFASTVLTCLNGLSAASNSRSTVYTQSSGSCRVTSGSSTAYGSYSGSSISSVPNYSGQAKTAQSQKECRELTSNALSIGRNIEASALRANSVNPGDTVSGSVFFERKGSGDVVTVSIPAGASSFHFRFRVDNPSSVLRTICLGPDKIHMLKPRHLSRGKSAATF